MKNQTGQTLLIYLRHLKRYWLGETAMVLAILSATIFNVVTPLYYKKFFDILASAQITDAAVRGLVSTILFILLLAFIQWAWWRVATYLAVRIGASMMADLHNTCFQYLHHHSYSYFNNNFVGSLVRRVGRFVRSYDAISDNVHWTIAPLFVNVFLVVAILLYKNFALGMLVIGWVVFFLAVNVVFIKFKLKYDIEASAADSQANGFLADSVANHNNVKLFCGYDREIASFSALNDIVKRLRTKAWNWDILFEAVQHFLMIILEFAVFYYAVNLWRQRLFTIGDFVLLQSYVLLVFLKIWDFGKVMRRIYQDLADAEEMTQILNTPHEIKDRPTAAKLVVKRGRITFDKINFFYDQANPILRRFSLVIKPGEKVALVGPSGAGKSTVIRLLLRLHEVKGGVISVDGHNITDVTQESLWSNISLVPQDPILFHRTLLENIRYGQPKATNSAVYKAAKLAHCHEFIGALPDGYNTYVGERGVKLSGGERQRVAIARAILRNTPILVLDEATSSLDSESEQLIQDALGILMKNKTVIAIAHRLSTIMKMDRILVMENGQIKEDGTHQSLLLKADGVYKKLWQLQAGGFID